MSHAIKRRQAIKRIRKLENEWDLDRAIELHGGVAIIATLLMSRLVSKRFLFATGAIAAFLASHALGRWTPQAALLSRLGFRTRREIDHEKSFLLSTLTVPHPASPARAS